MVRSAAVQRTEAPAEAHPQAARPANPVHAHVLQLQRTAGNRAVARMVDDAALDRDVNEIAALLKQQALWASDERKIVAIFTRHQGTPGLARLIQKLKGKVIVRATARSAWQDTWVNAWDTLFYELEGGRLETFKSIVSSAGQAAMPESENSENFWKTLGEQEAIGMMGAVKGLSTGAAGVVDLGSWAATKSANAYLKPISQAIGTDVTLAEPIKLADHVSKGWDDIGDMTFGKDKWSNAEKLLPGMSAAEIGNLGGSIIWSLTMMGAGGAGSSAQAKALLTGIDILGKVKSVEDQCTSMASYLERKAKEGPITWARLSGDAEFWVECTKLATAIASAVALGATSEKGAAATVKKVLDAVAPYLKAGEAVAKVAQIIQILNNPKLAPKEKEARAAKIVGELIAMAFDLVGEKAKKADESRAKQATEKKQRVEQAREQIRKEVAAGKAEQEAAKTKPLETKSVETPAPAAPEPVPIPFPTTAAGPAPAASPHDFSDLDIDAALNQGFTADDGLHTIAMDAPPLHKPKAAPAPVPVKEGTVSPTELRGVHGMPEGNQRRIQDVAEKHGVIIDVRPTTAQAPELLEQGAIPKMEDLKSKTIGAADQRLGAGGHQGEVGFFKPQASGDLAGGDANRWWQRDMEFWDNAQKMTELQKPVAQQRGTHETVQVVVGADGTVRAVDPAGGAPKVITGDHDVFDIRKADGSALTREEYLAVLNDLKQGNMGVLHGAHMRWGEDLMAAEGREMTPAEKGVFDAIMARHQTGGEAVIRFAPNKAPQTAQVR
jgi:hypothetical protein